MSLLEMIVASALVTLVTAGIYTTYGPANTASKVQAQSHFLSQLRDNVDSAYRTANTFAGISVASAETDRWYPSSPPEASWGAFTLAPTTNPSTGTANDSWEATYAAVPSDACGRLIADQINQWDEIQVGGTPVQSTSAALGECASYALAEVAFVRYGGRRSNGAALAPLCFNLKAGAPIPADCPSGGSYAPAPPGYTAPTPLPPPIVVIPPPIAPPPSPSQPTGPVVGLPAPTVPAPPGTPSPAPTPAPLPPPPTYTPCSAPPPQSQTLGCPTGQTGQVTQSRSATCPSPYASATWGPWSTTANTCTPSSPPPFSPPPFQGGPIPPPSSPTPCTAPAPTTQTSSQPASCPAGQKTSGGASTFTQTQSRSVTYSCFSGNLMTTYGPWSPWSPTAATVCS